MLFCQKKNFFLHLFTSLKLFIFYVTSKKMVTKPHSTNKSVTVKKLELITSSEFLRLLIKFPYIL